MNYSDYFNESYIIPEKNFQINEEYERPYSMKEIKKNYGDDYYNKLKNDPIHRWRAETGIELIHREPSKEELERIMKNWESMDDRRKRISDKKSMEVFGCSNKDNYNKLIKAYNETNLDTLIFSPESIIQKEVTLYHGTRNKIPNKIIDPAYGRLNVGNKFNKRVRYSTWWVKDPTFAVTYSVQDHLFDIMREKGYFPENYKFNTKTFFDIISGHFYNDPKNRILWIDEQLKDDFIKRCNNKPGYVYSTTVPWNIVSRGHDIGLDEYTLDEPVKCNEHIINFNNLKKFVTVKFASKDEILLRCGRQQRELHDVSLLKRFAYYPQTGKINRGTVAIQHGENLTRRKQEKYN